MIAPKTSSPTPCVDAEDGADSVSLPAASDGIKPVTPADFAVIYVANRYRLPMHVAALVVRLANIERAL
jgi:hypothetical protein